MITLRKNGEVVNEYTPTYSGQNIVIAIDSSKSNSALIVGTPKGRVLDDYEIVGSGSDVDVYELCRYTRQQLRALFADAKILLVGIEDIITKKSENYKGLDIHQSRAKITAVFNNYIFLFQDYFNITPMFINNWAWKSYVLPESYRTKKHKKGSKDYFKDIGSDYGGRKDDVTDALCIYMYITNTFRPKVVNTIDVTCPTSKKHMFAVFPENVELPNSEWFEIRNNDTLEHNVSSVAEALSGGKVGLFKWPIDKLTLDIIYSDKLSNVGKCVFTRQDKNVIICVGVQ